MIKKYIFKTLKMISQLGYHGVVECGLNKITCSNFRGKFRGVMYVSGCKYIPLELQYYLNTYINNHVLNLSITHYINIF